MTDTSPRLRTRSWNLQGQRIGSKGQVTRQRLLDATVNLLKRRSLGELRVSEIADRAGTSAPTFYLYFRDADDAVLTLARQAAESERPAIEILEREWPEEETLELARQFVDQFVSYWDRHAPILRVRNMAFEAGRPGFRKVRDETLAPMLRALEKKIRSAQRAGRLSPRIHPYTAAAATVASLERLSAFYTNSKVKRRGVTRPAVVETLARILTLTLTGSSDAPEG